MDPIGMLFALHNIGIIIWVGAAVLTPLGIIPAMAALDVPSQQKFFRRLATWWAPLLVASAILVGLTGWAQTTMIDDVNIPVLIVKHVLVLLLVVAGLFIAVWPGRKLMTMAEPTPERQKLWMVFQCACWIQAVIGVAVLVVVGQLMV